MFVDFVPAAWRRSRCHEPSPEIGEREGKGGRLPKGSCGRELIVSGASISIMSGADSARLPIVTPRTPNSAGAEHACIHLCLSVCVRPPTICHRGFRSAHCALPRGALAEDPPLMRALRFTRFSLCVIQGASASGWHPDWRMCSSY